MLNHNREPSLIEWAIFTTPETDCNLIQCDTTSVISCKKSVSEEKWQKVGIAYDLGKIALISPMLTTIVEVGELCQHFHLNKKRKKRKKKQQQKLILPRTVWHIRVFHWQQPAGQLWLSVSRAAAIFMQEEGPELEVFLFLMGCMASCKTCSNILSSQSQKMGSLSPPWSAVNMQSCWLDTMSICVWYKTMCA